MGFFVVAFLFVFVWGFFFGVVAFLVVFVNKELSFVTLFYIY